MSADSAFIVSGSDLINTKPCEIDVSKQPSSFHDPSGPNDEMDDVTPGSGMDALEWSNGIGVLPGSNIKFQMNTDGELEMISEKVDNCNSVIDDVINDQPTVTENGGESAAVEEVERNPDLSPRVVAAERREPPSDETHIHPRFSRTCLFCGRVGDGRKFCGNFCSKTCIARNAGKHKRFIRNGSVKYAKRVGGVHRGVRGMRGRRPHDPGDLKIKIRLPSSNGCTRRKHSIVNDDVDYGKRRNVTGLSTRTNRSRFSWEEHWRCHSLTPAIPELFINPFPVFGNLFEVGQLLEAIDPEHESMFCLASVASKCGHRIRLHFEGFPSVFNFWVNADSSKIFPCGFCDRTGRSLAPPRGQDASSFRWREYAEERKLSAAPDKAFACLSFENQTKFKVHDKLEAVDRKHPDLTCVATVTDVISDYVLIHFDGWNSDYDYWAHMASNYLRPIGWCHDNNKALSPPLNFKGEFEWGEYLRDHSPADRDAFLCKPHGFKVGMSLEVVDPRNPMLVRVASVVDTDEYRVKIHFDGWSDMYDVWMDADSPDIHPPTWSERTHHPLQAPITHEQLTRDDNGCPIPGCNGAGHVQHDKYVTHHSEFGCPYSPQNLSREPPPDRLSFPTESRHELMETLEPDSRRRGCYRGRKRGRGRASNSHWGGRRVSREIPESRNVEPTYHLRRSRLSSFNDSPIYRAAVLLHQNKRDDDVPDLWHQHVKLLPGVMGTRARDVKTWDIAKVAEFVQELTGKEDYAEIFSSQEIDGEALLMLTQTDMSSLLKLKLGPSVKIYNAIVMFKLADRLNI